MNAASNKNPEVFFLASLIIAAALCLAPWFFIQIQQSVNADNAWLTIAAMRFLSGDTMSKGFYDPNPPLSMLVQIIPALLTKYAHIPLYYAVFFYSLFLVALSSWAVNRLAAASGVFGRNERHLLMAGYVLCNTLLAEQYLGEREQYILLVLLPFVLVQAGITLNWPLPRRTKLAVLIIGSVAMLIKPYFGLIPAALLAHRMLRQRRATVVLDADCVALVAATVIYLLIIALAFTDYVRVILPDVLNLYVPLRAFMVMPIAVCLGLLCLLLASLSVLLPGAAGKINAGLFGLAALCLIPFFIQGKGYFYHAFPTLVFFCCGLLLLTYQAAAPIVEKRIPRLVPALPTLVFVLFAAMSYAALPPNASYPTHDDYREIRSRRDHQFMRQALPVFPVQRHVGDDQPAGRLYRADARLKAFSLLLVPAAAGPGAVRAGSRPARRFSLSWTRSPPSTRRNTAAMPGLLPTSGNTTRRC